MKKVTLLPVLLLASTVVLAGCSGTEPTSTEPSTTAEPAVTDWSDEVKALMTANLDGTILPFIQGTWKASASNGMLQLTSKDASLDAAKAAFVAANYKDEEAEAMLGVAAYSIRSAGAKGRVTAVVSGDASGVSIQAMFEEEPEQYWGFMDKQYMAYVLNDYLPYKADEWDVSLNMYNNLFVIATAKTLTVAELVESYEAAGYLVSDEQPAGYYYVDPVAFSDGTYNMGLIQSVRGFATVQAKNGSIASPFTAVGINPAIVGAISQVDGVSSSAPFGIHSGSTVRLSYSIGDYYDDPTTQVSFACDSEEIVPVAQGANYQDIQINAAAGTTVKFTMTAEKGDVKKTLSVSVKVVANEVKLDWTDDEKTLMTTAFGTVLPFSAFGPDWSFAAGSEAGSYVFSAPAGHAKDIRPLFENSFPKKGNAYVANSAAGLYEATIASSSEATTVTFLPVANQTAWSDEDKALMTSELGAEVPFFLSAYYGAWAEDFEQGISVTAYNIPQGNYYGYYYFDAADMISAFEAAGYTITDSSGNLGSTYYVYISFGKALSTEPDSPVLYVDIEAHGSSGVTANAYVSEPAPAPEPVPYVDAFPAEEIGEYINNMVAERFPFADDFDGAVVVSPAEIALPDGVTLSYNFTGNKLTLKFSAELTSEQQSAFIDAYAALLEAAGYTVGAPFYDSPLDPDNGLYGEYYFSMQFSAADEVLLYFYTNWLYGLK